MSGKRRNVSLGSQAHRLGILRQNLQREQRLGTQQFY